MALTLKDVVESRLQQRASGARRELVETRDATQSRRERFSLEDADRRDALDARMRASTKRTEATEAETAKADTSKTEAGRAQTKRSEAERPGVAGAERPSGPKPSARPSPATSAAAGRPARPLAEQAHAQAGIDDTKDATVDAGASSGQATTDAASIASAATEMPAATPSILAIFVAPPPASAPAGKTGEPEPDGGSEAVVTDGTTTGTGVLEPGTRAAGVDDPVATKPVFDAALADVAVAATDSRTTPTTISAGDCTTAALGATVAPPAPSEAKAAGAVNAAAQLHPPPSSASAPIPLGAVPMTIGLRALGTSNRFEIRLDPKDLGRIDVSIDIDKDRGTVGASLVVERPETLALLQRDSSNLQQALAQTGLDASAGVSLSLRGDGEGRHNGGETGAGAQARQNGQTDRTGSQAGTSQNAVDLVPLRALRGLGRVDLRI